MFGIFFYFVLLSPLLTHVQQSSGPLKLLVSHHHRSSNCSDLSLHSGSNLSSSLASSSHPLYDEILAPSGYRIGETKSILIRKVNYILHDSSRLNMHGAFNIICYIVHACTFTCTCNNRMSLNLMLL